MVTRHSKLDLTPLRNYLLTMRINLIGCPLFVVNIKVSHVQSNGINQRTFQMNKSNAIQYPSNILNIFSVLLIMSMVSACATEGGKEAGKGAKWGAAGGAVLGLGLGAITGDKKMMLAGAATGAAVGGASGAMYEYGQHRDDKRNKELANAIAGSNISGSNSNAGQPINNPLEGFIGEWKVNAWGLLPDGNRVTAAGKGKGILTARNTARVDYFDIKADGYKQTLTGYAIINFDEKDGLTLTTYGSDNEVDARFVGEYITDQKKFNFYLSDSRSANTVTGILKSDVRMEVRVAGANLWFVETYTMLNNKDTQIQSYRFSKT